LKELQEILRPGYTGNASGVCDITGEQLQELFDSDADFVVTKSITLDGRKGNEEPRLVGGIVHKHDTLNSVGLPNLGVDEYERIFPALKKHGKPLVVSISYSPTAEGTMEEQYKELSRRLSKYADVLEVNASCPNLGPQITANDPEKVRSILEIVKFDGPILVKLPPYNNIPKVFEKVVNVLRDLEVDGVTTVNSLARCMYIDPGTEESVIAPKGGYGGFGGPSILPLALAEVNRWHDKNFYVLGVGGINSGKTMYQHILAGATAVQIGSALHVDGPEIFRRVKGEIGDLLRVKGVYNIADKIGAVQKAYIK
jgi:dihydroorotate dehydrogenase (fumarate)